MKRQFLLLTPSHFWCLLLPTAPILEDHLSLYLVYTIRQPSSSLTYDFLWYKGQQQTWCKWRFEKCACIGLALSCCWGPLHHPCEHSQPSFLENQKLSWEVPAIPGSPRYVGQAVLDRAIIIHPAQTRRMTQPATQPTHKLLQVTKFGWFLTEQKLTDTASILQKLLESSPIPTILKFQWCALMWIFIFHQFYLKTQWSLSF